MKPVIALAITALSGQFAVAATTACPLAGEPVQWIADYCMAAAQTDDIEVVMPCIDKAGEKKFSSSCQARQHFKQRLCEVTLPYSGSHASVAQCVADPAFAGSTVRNDGH